MTSSAGQGGQGISAPASQIDSGTKPGLALMLVLIFPSLKVNDLYQGGEEYVEINFCPFMGIRKMDSRPIFLKIHYPYIF